MVVGRGPRKALLFHKDLDGERRNIWAENFQAVGTACAADCPGESGKSQEVRVAAADTSGGQVMGKGGETQARGCLQELGARFVWSEFHFNKDSLAALWGINCRGQG